MKDSNVQTIKKKMKDSDVQTSPQKKKLSENSDDEFSYVPPSTQQSPSIQQSSPTASSSSLTPFIDPDIEARLHEIAQDSLKVHDSSKIKRLDSSMGKEHRDFINIDTNERVNIPVLPVFQEIYPDEPIDSMQSIVYNSKTPRKRQLRSGKLIDLQTPKKQHKYTLVQSPFRKFNSKKKTKKLPLMWENL